MTNQTKCPNGACSKCHPENKEKGDCYLPENDPPKKTIYFAREGKSPCCEFCGISAFAHYHKPGSKPRDFVRGDLCPECSFEDGHSRACSLFVEAPVPAHEWDKKCEHCNPLAGWDEICLNDEWKLHQGERTKPPAWLRSYIMDLLATTKAQTLAEVKENILAKHNAEILNQFQLQGKPDMPIIAYDERVCLIPAIAKATEITIKRFFTTQNPNKE